MASSGTVTTLWPRAPRRPDTVRALLTATMGFFRATLPRDPAELAGVTERLEVEEDDVGLLVVGPEPQKVVPADVGFVTEGDEARHPEAAAGQLAQKSDAETTGLRRKSDAPAGRRVLGDAGVHPYSGAGVDEPMHSGPTSRMPKSRAV